MVNLLLVEINGHILNVNEVAALLAVGTNDAPSTYGTSVMFKNGREIFIRGRSPKEFMEYVLSTLDGAARDAWQKATKRNN